MQKQMWKLYRKFATEKIRLWQPAREPHDSSHAQDLTIVEQGVTFLVDDHYHATGTASHLTTIIAFLFQRRFKTQHCKHGLNQAVGLIFTAPSTTPRREHSSSQEQTDGNTQTPVTPLCIQSEAGSFLRHRIFAKQHAHLPSDERRGRKGLVTNTLNYLPSPSSETQQNQVNQHICPSGIQWAIPSAHLYSSGLLTL